jgi:hypothetical protein
VTAEIRCDSCKTAIPAESWNRENGAPCAVCRTQVRVQVFPAVLSTKRGTSAEPLATDSEAACFFHPQSRASIACDGCGRFLCGLCDLDLNGQHVCPICLQKGVAKSSAAVLDNRRVLYDSIALGLSIFGAAFFLWPSIITGPLSIVLSIWYWRRPRSIVPRTSIRFILAIVFSLIQCLLWGAMFWAVATASKRGGA